LGPGSRASFLTQISKKPAVKIPTKSSYTDDKTLLTSVNQKQ